MGTGKRWANPLRMARPLYRAFGIFFRTIWRVVGALRSFLVVALLLFSLTLNGAMFTGGKLFSLATLAAEGLIGRQTIVSRTKAELAEEHRLRRQLQGRTIRLSRRVSQQERRIAGMERKMSGLKREFGAARASRKALREQARRIIRRISRRTARKAVRNVGEMFGEAVPYLGIAVIVAGTTLDVKDACDTMRDMSLLEQLHDPSAAPDPDVMTVCSLRVPTRAEILARVRAAPGAVWNGVKDGSAAIVDGTVKGAAWVGDQAVATGRALKEGATSVGESMRQFFTGGR